MSASVPLLPHSANSRRRFSTSIQTTAPSPGRPSGAHPCPQATPETTGDSAGRSAGRSAGHRPASAGAAYHPVPAPEAFPSAVSNLPTHQLAMDRTCVPTERRIRAVCNVFRDPLLPGDAPSKGSCSGECLHGKHLPRVFIVRPSRKRVGTMTLFQIAGRASYAK